MKGIRWLLTCSTGIALGLAVPGSSRPLAFDPAQQGPPSAPPSTAPPSEPVQLHAPPPHPPGDFEGPHRDITPRRCFNPAQTRKEAEELAALAGKITGEVDKISNGVLPKDLAEQLKQIQRLAKRLRGEVSP